MCLYAGETKLEPLTLQCSLFSHRFDGITDHTGDKEIAVTLSASNSNPNGHRRVSKLGQFEISKPHPLLNHLDGYTSGMSFVASAHWSPLAGLAHGIRFLVDGVQLLQPLVSEGTVEICFRTSA